MASPSLFSPISLRYVAALRGNLPARTGTEFSYAEAACTNPESLICLAASNPEGRFYGFMADATTAKRAEEMATERGTFNVIFLSGTPSQVLARIEAGASLPPMLDYICCDESGEVLPESERKALFNLAKARLLPGGLFVTSYPTKSREDEPLRFLVQELVPEMTSDQQQELLTEIKKLGALFFINRPDMLDVLDRALANKTPRDFFALCEGEKATSRTFDTIVSATSQGFLYAGDASPTMNYVEMSIPHEAQDLVVSCRQNILYEPIKDFALNRDIRSDIWVKAPAETSSDPAELFGRFSYGIIVPREQIPATYAAKGKAIDLSGQLYTKILDLMSIMPLGIGDFLSSSSGKDENPQEVLDAIQVLVACGFALPMRGMLSEININGVAQPKLVGGFNRFLDKQSLTGREVLFASQVAGCGMVLSAKEAFVMQALNRAGLLDSAKALIPELSRIANTPAAESVLESKEPSPEVAHRMVLEVIEESLPKWYAYAIVEAA